MRTPRCTSTVQPAREPWRMRSHRSNSRHSPPSRPRERCCANGWFFGPGTSYDPNDMIPNGLRAGTIPIAGSGAGNYSFILRDAAGATVEAVAHEASGIFNTVDDAPVRSHQFLPAMATLLGAPEPQPLRETDAREKYGDLRVYYWNELRAASNAKAKREFGWQPRSRYGQRASRSCTRHRRLALLTDTATATVTRS